MPLGELERVWYYGQIEKLDPTGTVAHVDRVGSRLIYHASIRCDESRDRPATDEELVRALALCLLIGDDYKYSTSSFWIEKYYKHGHPSSKHDEVDLVIFDNDELPFAMWEFKSPDDYDKSADDYIQYQLFGTAPLVGAPRLLAYATIKPGGHHPFLTLICIDRSKYASYDSWVQNGQPHSKTFPEAYSDPSHQPFVQGGAVDIRFDCTQADFRAVAATFHNEFFSEHPDNVLFTNLMKCLLPKIYDERQTKKNEPYGFQVLYHHGKEETAESVFARVNGLYKTAYKRYIETDSAEVDEINPNEFSRERVKTVVKALQAMSITRGAALHGDVIGAFFEEILRAGFKQDKGMYFTHANLVYFMLEALDLDGLAVETWKKATHPENRLPYVIDPACGSGAFLLRTMHIITNAIRSRKGQLATDMDSLQFSSARMSDEMPHYWAEHFLYGMDPKFIMAITAKINMVLHGDGSAHVFKYDALKPFTTFMDDKLRPIGDPQRTISKERYPYDVVESFDVVVSNPPFGITLASETMAALPMTFGMRKSFPSECLFLERWFQLLKPKGRLGVVVPESLLNAAETVTARMFLYRTFWIRSIVALPRNLFIETPTLTSLLFAQKKTADEIDAWDQVWFQESDGVEQTLNKVRDHLLRNRRNGSTTPEEIQQFVVEAITPILAGQRMITRKGRSPLTIVLPQHIRDCVAACAYYLDLLKASGFDILVRNFIFDRVSAKFDYEYPVFLVEEVGYKLSKRKERVRPNQLCRFLDTNTKEERPNLHLADGPVELAVNVDEPQRVLDYIRRDVKWS
jgi:type I restriction enzyme M protein